MTLKQFIRNAIIGRDRYIASHSVYKTTILRGYFSALLLVSALFYLVYDLNQGVTGNIPVFCLLFLVSISAFLLNRNEKYLLSNVVLLTFVNFVTFLFTVSYSENFVVIMFFTANALLAMVVFEYRQKPWWISFVLLSYVLFLIAHLSDPATLQWIRIDGLVVKSSATVNFTLSFFISFLMLFFRINLNHHVEETLKENEESLLDTTAQLQKSRQRFELAIKGSNAGIWEWDVTNNVVYNSPAWKKMLGFEEHELKAMTVEGFLERVFHEDHEKVKHELNEHLSKLSPYHPEFRMVKKDGSIIWVKDNGIGITDADGRVIQMVGSITDISEAKEAEQKIIKQNVLLAKTNAELDRFVYSTSHDLRSPLSSLLGLIIIAEKTDDPEEVSACLGMMKDRIRTMESFIKEIIDYSRNTRLEVKDEPVKVFPLIHEVVENLRFSEGAENIFVRYNIPADLNIHTDENRLKVVLNNLIGNSIKYHDGNKENPFISIEAEQQGSHIKIIIEDNGIGIGQEHQSKIFDMFYRASEKSHGSGLGLYIVKETIEKLSGKVEVSSTSGKGTSFFVHLPVKPATHEFNPD